MASLSSLGLNLRLADIDENLKSHPAALSWPTCGIGGSAPSMGRDFIDNVPCFAYNEVFESGEVFQAVSPGSGIYLPLHSSPCPRPAFTLSKCRLSKTIELEIQSLSLWQSLAIAMPSPFDFPSILANYPTLKSYLQHLENISPSHPSTAELRLLVRDLILDRAVYAGIGTEFYRSKGLLSMEQLQDMHQRSVDAGLDDLDACFSLGLLPDIVDDAYLEALISRFTELALAGDLAALHDLCEPVVRSGEIEWQTNPDLLLELLDRGRMDIYRYVLDLASRTRDKPTSQTGSCLPDVTHDTLHVAIRLGHMEQVESLLHQGAAFLGVHCDDAFSGISEQIVLTPLSAAVLWGQAEVVRLILQRNPLPAGFQEAVAMAVSKNDTEIMQILLSSGVVASSGASLADDTVDSFAELCIMDQQPVLNTQTQLTTAEPKPQDHNSFDAYHTTLGKPPSNPPKEQRSLPKEPIQRKGSRQRRHLLGRDLVTCMHSLCFQLRAVCNCSDHDELHDLGNDYIYENGVWDRGLGVFRGLMQDNPPSALVEVVDSLLVANAICLALFKDDDSLFIQFLNDLHRWRSVLPVTSHILFDDLAFGMWAFTPAVDTASEPDPDSLPRFQELVQSLVSLERRREAIPSRSSAAGSRLSAIQRNFETHETELGAGQPQAIPGRSPTRQTAQATSSTQQDDFMWADFLHMDRLEDTTRGQSRTPPAPNSWEDALSSTMMLLASVAFAMVLAMIVGLHLGSATRAVEMIITTLPGYARTCMLLAQYLTMHGASPPPKPETAQAAPPPAVPPSPAYASEPCLTPTSSFSSLSTLGMRRNVSSSSISSVGSFAPSSPSRPSSHEHPPPRGNRLPCPTPQCTKTFSSVSNRNKHLREGCAFTREKRQGYQCRNGPCTRVLTTKWYRDTHEKDRCRFRRGD